MFLQVILQRMHIYKSIKTDFEVKNTFFCVQSTWPRPIMGSNQVFSNAGHFFFSINLYFFVPSVLECALLRLLDAESAPFIQIFY
jgi:hypothetical protein